MKAKFYLCRHCGNLVGMIHDAGVPLMCCGEKMEALVPNTVEANLVKTSSPREGIDYEDSFRTDSNRQSPHYE